MSGKVGCGGGEVAGLGALRRAQGTVVSIRPQAASSTGAEGCGQALRQAQGTGLDTALYGRCSAAGDERPGGAAKLGVVERDRPQDLEIRQPGFGGVALLDVGGAQADDDALVDRRQVGKKVPRIFALAAAGLDSRIENVAGLLPELRQGE